jgi:hypothetical protein
MDISIHRSFRETTFLYDLHFPISQLCSLKGLEEESKGRRRKMGKLRIWRNENKRGSDQCVLWVFWGLNLYPRKLEKVVQTRNKLGMEPRWTARKTLWNCSLSNTGVQQLPLSSRSEQIPIIHPLSSPHHLQQHPQSTKQNCGQTSPSISHVLWYSLPFIFLKPWERVNAMD